MKNSIVDRSNWTYADYLKHPEVLQELAKNDESKFKILAKAHYGLSKIEEKPKTAAERNLWAYADYLRSPVDMADLAKNDGETFKILAKAHYGLSKVEQKPKTAAERNLWAYADYMQSPVDMADLAKNDEETFNHLFKAHYSLTESDRLKVEQTARKLTEDRSNWTYADYQDNDPKALRELSETNEAKFERLFNAHYGK